MTRTFGERVKNYRIDKDLKQIDVAKQIPMNQSNYSKIEQGKQEPSLYQLKRISEILNVSVDELLGINRTTIDKEKLDVFQKELDKLFNKFFS